MVYYFTPEGFKKIGNKLMELKKKFSKARLPEERAFLWDMILDIGRKIQNSKVITKRQKNKVQVGSGVLVEINGKKSKFTVVGKGLIDPSIGNISYESPVGKALMGKSVGDTFNVYISGVNHTFKIVEIE